MPHNASSHTNSRNARCGRAIARARSAAARLSRINSRHTLRKPAPGSRDPIPSSNAAAGALDGPSGFGWSPDGATFYVAGRYSANVLAYDAATGAPATNHLFATGLGAGSTFGLAVDPVTGDVFVATGGDVHRYTPDGSLAASIPIPGTAIGLELEPGGNRLFVATNNNLYPVTLSNNTVGAAFLSGSTHSTLNFFHFSSFADAQVAVAYTALETVAGQPHFAFTFTLSRRAIKRTATVRLSPNQVDWTPAAIYTPNDTGAVRNGATNTVQSGVSTNGEILAITERDAQPVSENAARFFQVITH